MGKPFARSLAEVLTHRGYDVFLDVDCLDAGQWAAQILTRVPIRAHFLLLLTPGALDRCADGDDWVRREFLAAMQHGRNIVPVREESVDLAAQRQACPPSVKDILGLKVTSLDPCHASLQHAVDRLRRAGAQHHLPCALLTRAWCSVAEASFCAEATKQQAADCVTSAQRDLDEAWEIAQRGPMRLFMADVHLHRARLFFRAERYPWESPQADLAAAEKLINECGYHRRDEELADAKRAILGEE